MKVRHKLLALVLLMVGCQTISQSTVREFPGAPYSRVWLAAQVIAHRQWTVVREDSTRGVLVAVAGEGGSGEGRPFEYRVHVGSTDEGSSVAVSCWSTMFGRRVELEELYLADVADKFRFLSPRRRP